MKPLANCHTGPLAPGKTKTYSFLATQYGSTWYHSHYSVQYGNGLVGPLIINGPATANYDEDLGSQILGDWWYKDAFQEAVFQDEALNNPSSPGAGPKSDNILVNGTNKNPAGTNGAYQRTTIASGKKYRLRLINTSIDAQLRVALDNHTLEVIAADFVPIVPFNTSSLLLAIGQRYDVLITANQKPANYWFRAEPATDCASSSKGLGLSIFTYKSVEAGTPTATTNTTLSTPGCNPEADIEPFVAVSVDKDTFQSQIQELNVSINTPGVKYLNSSIAAWGVNLSNIDVKWDRPTLDFIAANDSAYPEGYNVVQIPKQGVWTYWVVQEIPNNLPNSPNITSIPHPFHLHGHDFWVLGNSTNSNFSARNDLASLNFNNPPRRDVTFLPASGWVVLAFYSDNPGAWLMHCHIAWHVSEGLAMQFVESNSSIPAPDAAWNQTCQEWDDYYSTAEFKQTDSGL